MIQIRVSESEYEAVAARAERAGKTITAYLMDLALRTPQGKTSAASKPTKPAPKPEPKPVPAVAATGWVSPHRKLLAQIRAHPDWIAKKPNAVVAEQTCLADAMHEECGDRNARPPWALSTLPPEDLARRFPRTSAAWDYALLQLSKRRIERDITDPNLTGVERNGRWQEELRNLKTVSLREDLLRTMAVTLPGEKRKSKGTGEPGPPQLFQD